MSAQFVLTADQLAKIQDLSSQLSRDPAFLSAVGKAYKSVAPDMGPDHLRNKTASEHLAARLSRDPAFLTSVEQAFKGVLPKGAADDSGRKEELASFGWSIPVADDDGHSSAAVMAAIAVAAAGALAEK